MIFPKETKLINTLTMPIVKEGYGHKKLDGEPLTTQILTIIEIVPAGVPECISEVCFNSDLLEEGVIELASWAENARVEGLASIPLSLVEAHDVVEALHMPCAGRWWCPG